MPKYESLLRNSASGVEGEYKCPGSGYCGTTVDLAPLKHKALSALRLRSDYRIRSYVARQFANLSLTDSQQLLTSKIHEERNISLIILVNQFNKANQTHRIKIAKFYLKNLRYVNNWDLVDGSAPKILGPYLEIIHQPQNDLLTKLVYSKNLWHRRIAILTTFYFIQKNQPRETLRLAKILLNDKEDLIHKAVGWMLRELGKQCGQEILEKFLRRYKNQMPRTMLRYAIERLPTQKRKFYLSNLNLRK